MFTGGCFCGYVRYEVSGQPFFETVCHCSICRRTTGAPMVAWFTVRPDGFRITSGALTMFRSSSSAQRGFCPKCGAQLVFREDNLDEVDVTTASLDDPEAVPPRAHIWTRNGLSWIKLADGLPRHAERPSG